MLTPDEIIKNSKKVTQKAATLVETAADIAEDAFEKAVDRADMVSATTANKLVNGARSTSKLAKKNSRTLGISAMIGGIAALLGGLAILSLKANTKSKKSKRHDA